MLKKIGYAIVEWFDACFYERVGSLENCNLILQETVGFVYRNERDKTLIIVTTSDFEKKCFDALVVPESWIWNIKKLQEVKNGKQPAKKVD